MEQSTDEKKTTHNSNNTSKCNQKIAEKCTENYKIVIKAKIKTRQQQPKNKRKEKRIMVQFWRIWFVVTVLEMLMARLPAIKQLNKIHKYMYTKCSCILITFYYHFYYISRWNWELFYCHFENSLIIMIVLIAFGGRNRFTSSSRQNCLAFFTQWFVWRYKENLTKIGKVIRFSLSIDMIDWFENALESVIIQIQFHMWIHSHFSDILFPIWIRRLSIRCSSESIQSITLNVSHNWMRLERKKRCVVS